MKPAVNSPDNTNNLPRDLVKCIIPHHVTLNSDRNRVTSVYFIKMNL